MSTIDIRLTCICVLVSVCILYTALFVLYYVLASWHLLITSWNKVGVIGSADENYLKDVFGSFLCASYCACTGVSKPQNPGSAGSNHTGSLTFYLFLFYLFLKINWLFVKTWWNKHSLGFLNTVKNSFDFWWF